jgi:hypothetical protein
VKLLLTALERMKAGKGKGKGKKEKSSKGQTQKPTKVQEGTKKQVKKGIM